jgi:DNA-binding MarR family transcriptional regulator
MESGVLLGDDVAFWRAFLHWSQSVHTIVNRAVTDAADLSVPEFEVLTHLWNQPDSAMPQLDLVAALGWSASRASHLLRRLEDRGLVGREDTGQGRARTVSLTDAGKAHLVRAFDVHGRAFRDSVLDRLTEHQRTILMTVMTTPTSGAKGRTNYRQSAASPR